MRMSLTLSCLALAVACTSFAFTWQSYSKAACVAQANQIASIEKIRRELGDEYTANFTAILKKDGMIQKHWWC
jgi:hypothetical protein